MFHIKLDHKLEIEILAEKKVVYHRILALRDIYIHIISYKQEQENRQFLVID